MSINISGSKINIDNDEYTIELNNNNSLKIETVNDLKLKNVSYNNIAILQTYGFSYFNIKINNRTISPLTIDENTDPADGTVVYDDSLNLFFFGSVFSSSFYQFYYSPDGLNWIRTVNSSSSFNVYRMVVSPELGIRVATGTPFGGNIIYSNSLLSWTVVANPSTSLQWFGIDWSPDLGLFCCVSRAGVGDKIMTSPDGLNWTLVAGTSGFGNSRVVIWASGLNQFYNFSLGVTWYKSPDGINWTSFFPGIISQPLKAAWSPDLGLFVIITGTDGKTIVGDGNNWEQVSSLNTKQFFDVRWLPGYQIFMACGLNSEIAISSDGYHWNVYNLGLGVTFGNICYSSKNDILSIIPTTRGSNATNLPN